MAAALALCGDAAAQSAGSVPATGLREVSPALPAPGRDSRPAAVIAAAERVPEVASVLQDAPRARPVVYLREKDEWQVAFFDGDEEVAQVRLADRGPRVLEAWTGIQVAWTMARGYPGAFGRDAAALPVWLALLLALALPFLRPPWRMLHLDLAVVASLSISVACFSDGNIDASVPLAYPPLLYLLVRLALLARRAPGPPRTLRLRFGPELLLGGVLFLLGVRLGLQILNSNVIDVGYAGVIGADRIAHGEALYGGFPDDNPRGDTYGPLVYLLYAPFELVWPWSGTWDDLPAGHAAAAAFDLACVAGLYLAGRRARGHLAGLLLAYIWLACPLTLYAANSGANDPLVGVLVLAAVLAGSGAGRGALVAAAGLAKFAPLALLPLLVRSRAAAVGAGVVITALLGGVAVLDGGLTGLWERTIRFQLERDSPFSIWGLYDLAALQLAAQLAALALIAVLARSRPQNLAAAAAAILIAVQLGTTHWFYLYVVWFLPVALVALLEGYAVVSGRSTGSIETARPGASQRISTAMSHGSSSAAS